MKTRILSLLLLLPLTAFAAEHRTDTRETIAWQPGLSASMENLLGEVELVGGTGNEIVIELTVVANARTAADAEALAGQVTLQQSRRGDTVELWIDYPTAEHDQFIYRPGRWSGTTNTTYRGERVRITSRGSGADVHANLRITLPQGVAFEMANSVGSLAATGVNGEIGLRTGSGRIEASQGGGTLAARSGSGSIRISEHTGAVGARAGSGSISLEAITGGVDVRTGSGSIRAQRVAGDEVALRAGSGSVRIDDIQGALSIGTGSGSVRIGSLTAGDELSVTTGSGSVRADGDFSAVTNMRMRTGSGSIAIVSSGVPNVQLVASAGSGSVTVDVAGMSGVSARRNRVEATLGTGEGEARLSTGSGSIRFTAGQ